MEYRADLQGLQHGAHVLEIALIHTLGLVFLAPEGLDLVNAGQVVLQLGVQLTHLLLGDPEEGPYLFREDHTGDHDQRDRRTSDQGQLPVDDQQDDQGATEGDQIGDGLRNHVGVE